MKTSKRKFILALLLLAKLGALPGVPLLRADPFDVWQTRHPDPSAQAFFHGNGQWIGLYGEPGISGSQEITHAGGTFAWTKGSIPADFVPYHATYANGLWVAVGEDGVNQVNLFSAIFTSSDGTVWEEQTSGLDLLRSLNIDPRLQRVVYGGGLWLAAGSDGRYLTSVDGKNWTPRSGAHGQVTYGNGQWLALSYDGFTSGNAHLSSNGIDWTTHPLPFGVIRAAFAAGQWTALTIGPSGRSLVTSTNGMEWVTRYVVSTSEIYQHVEFGDERWLVVGSRDPHPETGRVNLVTLTSTNGSTWQRSVISSPTFIDGSTHSLRYGSGMWLLDGAMGLLFSVNTVDWAWLLPPPVLFSDLIYDSGQWTAVGRTADPYSGNQYLITTSVDGREWTSGGVSGDGSLLAVASGGGRRVASGMRTELPYSHSGVILTSLDGSEWTQAMSTGVNWSFFEGAAFGNGLFVVTGADMSGPLLFTSPDGFTWTRRDLPVMEGGLRKVRFAGGRFFALGWRTDASGQFLPLILTSTDAMTWSLPATMTGSPVSEAVDIDFADGTWMVLTYRTHADGFTRPTTTRSTNGTDWTVWDLDETLSVNSRFRAIFHVAGRWVIAGSVPRHGADLPVIWSSENGDQWTEHPDVAGLSFASDGKYLLMAGAFIRASGRLIAALPPLLRLAREGSGFSLWLSGEIGERYEIEQSPEVDAEWVPLQSVILATNPQEIPLDAPTGNRGFWRARGNEFNPANE